MNLTWHPGPKKEADKIQNFWGQRNRELLEFKIPSKFQMESKIFGAKETENVQTISYINIYSFNQYVQIYIMYLFHVFMALLYRLYILNGLPLWLLQLTSVFELF